MTTTHLSTERISAWMIGDHTPQEERHVRECADCGMEVERLKSSLELFRGSVRNWSEQQRVETAQRDWAARKNYGWRWATAVAGLALILGGLPMYRQQRLAEVARQDAMLLEQVNAELSESVPRSMEPLTKLVRTNR